MSPSFSQSSPRERRQLFFRFVLGAQPGGRVCIAYLDRGTKRFFEHWFSWPEQEKEMLDDLDKASLANDAYFCPQLFKSDSRNKDNVFATPCAWADLDDCPPDEMLVPPGAILLTSPERYQAFWPLERVKPVDAESISRKIAYAHADKGADRSGWDLTQLLRIPDTINFKRPAKPIVELIRLDSSIGFYRYSDFAIYPEQAANTKYDGTVFPPHLAHIAPDAGEKLLREKGLNYADRIWDLFTTVPDSGSDWSGRYWNLQHSLYEHGYDRNEVFTICQQAACNKFARDGRAINDPTALWADILRSEGRAEEHYNLLVPKPDKLGAIISESERAEVEAAGDTIIERYIDWASTLGDAAVQYHQAGGFIILSSLLCGSVRLETSFGVIVPNLWFLIAADTTLTRKSTAIDIAMDLLDEIDNDAIVATDSSIEGLFSALSTRPGRPSVFLRDEFSGMLEQMSKKDYMSGMPEMLTKLYDGKIQKRVLRKETIEVRNPRLIIFAGGIKNRIMDLLSFEMVSSGFIPRFVFITAESDVSKIRPIGPPEERDEAPRERVLQEFIDVAKHYVGRTQTIQIGKIGQVTQQITTSVRLTREAWDRYNQFEAKLVDRGMRHQMPDLMTPVGDRLGKSVLKSAILIAAARQRGEEVVVDKIDILRGIKYGEQWLEHVYEIVNGIGKTSYEKQLELVLLAIRRFANKSKDGKTSRSRIMQAYHLTARDTSQLLDTLEQRGQIRRERAGRTEALYPVGDFNG